MLEDLVPSHFHDRVHSLLLGAALPPPAGHASWEAALIFLHAQAEAQQPLLVRISEWVIEPSSGVASASPPISRSSCGIGSSG